MREKGKIMYAVRAAAGSHFLSATARLPDNKAV